jgi:hypothetical protein
MIKGKNTKIFGGSQFWSKNTTIIGGMINLDRIIKQLFANNEQGFAYDFNDLTTLYQDSNGATPVTAVGQVVGLVLDKSKGLALGTELIVNGNFTSTASWSATNATFTVASNEATITNTTNAEGSIRQGTTTIGVTYKVTLTVGDNNGGGAIAVGGRRVSLGGTGTKTFYITAADTSGIIIGTNTTTTGTYLKVSNVSVKVIAGNHAFQATSASRPILGRHPKTGARNLVTYSSNTMDSSWSFSGTRTGGQLDSRGTYKAVKFVGASTAVPTKRATAQVSGPHTLTIRLKGVAGQTTSLALLLRNDTTSTNFTPTGVLDTTTGVISGTGWTSKSVDNGYWECTFTRATGISKGDSLVIYFGSVSAPDSTFGVTMDYAQLEAGSVATAFQDTTTLQDITEVGVDSVRYAYFDGIDDFLQTSSIDFTASDKMSLFVGVQKLSDATQMIYELSTSNVNNGMFGLLRGGGASDYIQSELRGTSIAYLSNTNSNLTAPANAVVTQKLDISGVTKQTLRVNSLELTSSSNAGTGNFGNYPLYIGRRGGTSLPFTGNLYELVGIGRITTQSEITSLEKSLASQLGVTL